MRVRVRMSVMVVMIIVAIVVVLVINVGLGFVIVCDLHDVVVVVVVDGGVGVAHAEVVGERATRALMQRRIGRHDDHRRRCVSVRVRVAMRMLVIAVAAFVSVIVVLIAVRAAVRRVERELFERRTARHLWRTFGNDETYAKKKKKKRAIKIKETSYRGCSYSLMLRSCCYSIRRHWRRQTSLCSTTSISNRSRSTVQHSPTTTAQLQHDSNR